MQDAGGRGRRESFSRYHVAECPQILYRPSYHGNGTTKGSSGSVEVWKPSAVCSIGDIAGREDMEGP